MVELRRAMATDFADVLPLFRQLWPSKPINEERLREVFLRVVADPSRQYLCATANGAVVGLGSLTVKDNLWQEGKIAFVEELVVREDMRGKGIDTQLLNRLVLSAREAGCRRVELDSALHRKEAHKFYEQHGFESRALLFSKPL